MKRLILILTILWGLGLTGRGFAQTIISAHAEVRSPNIFAVLSYLFPGFDPWCINRSDKLRQESRIKSSILSRDELAEPLGKECYSLNFDLGFMNNKRDGVTIPAAKLKFGF